ncbi:MAG: DUF1192 domain-containing protein [Pseudomonadota bacterium]
MFDDETAPVQKSDHVVGQDLSTLSLEELEERIALMRSEIERLEREIQAKRSTAEAANSVFKM